MESIPPQQEVDPVSSGSMLDEGWRERYLNLGAIQGASSMGAAQRQEQGLRRPGFETLLLCDPGQLT